MGRKKERRSSAGPADSAGPSGLGALLAAKGLAGSDAPDEPEAPLEEGGAATEATLAGQARAVLRMERKGRGGRTVTVVDALDVGILDAVARDLRKALGCGTAVEGDAVIVQGDQRARLEVWLLERGVRKVISG